MRAILLAVSCVLVLASFGPSGVLAQGTDTDGDGMVDVDDFDDDNDGVADAADSDPLDPDACRDADGDTCDDCALGTDDFGPMSDARPNHDGPDADADGLCDAGDPGTGPDTDGDGIVDVDDPDDDNDGVADATDSDPVDPHVCRDEDDDTCDDCAIGTDGFGPLADANPVHDGPDADADGLCDAGDPCPTGDADGDSVCDPADNCRDVANATQGDLDTDGHGDACDCDPVDEHVHPGAAEINDGIDNHCPGDLGYDLVDEIEGPLACTSVLRMCWSPQLHATTYKVIRSSSPQTTDCTVLVTAESCAEDASVPGEGEVQYYLVQAATPLAGSWGASSDGTEHQPACQ
jgi:hypothetical protein